MNIKIIANIIKFYSNIISGYIKLKSINYHENIIALFQRRLRNKNFELFYLLNLLIFVRITITFNGF